MYIFRLYACFDTTRTQSFDITLAASNEKEAIIKAKEIVSADRFIIREIIQKNLWQQKEKHEGE